MPLKTTLSALLLLLLGMAIGFTVCEAMHKKETAPVVVERREGMHDLINPLLACDAADNSFRTAELRPIKERITSYLQAEKDKGLPIDASIYFREMNDGPWFSIGETEKFVPASLRKIPMMIALLKMAEQDQGRALLDRSVKCDLVQDFTLKQKIKPAQALTPGRQYTVRDLIYRMIVYSDNNAFTLLSGVVDPLELEKVYVTLRLQNPLYPQEDEFLSVQTYASFFRVLYNATYLSRDASDWALGLLAKSEFMAGLVAGVPPNVKVAHKFGEHLDREDGTVQLHDCGIVYYPQHPYLLCVMSKGPNFEVLDDVIAEISRLTVSEIDEQHRLH